MNQAKRPIGEWIRWGILLLVMVGGWLVAYGGLQAKQEILLTIPPRVDALEKTVEVEKAKRESDRDLLQEVRQDVKDIRKAVMEDRRRR